MADVGGSFSLDLGPRGLAAMLRDTRPESPKIRCPK